VVCQGKRVSLDCITQKKEEKGGRKAVVRTAEQALQDFLKEAKRYNYAL
jgi:hypothetical protein